MASRQECFLASRSFSMRSPSATPCADRRLGCAPLCLRALRFGREKLVEVSARGTARRRRHRHLPVALLLLACRFPSRPGAQIWLASEFEWNRDWRRIAWYGSIILCGLLLYALISWTLLKIFSQQLQYLPSYVRPDLLEAAPRTILSRTLEVAWRFYSGLASIFLWINRPYRIFAVVCAAILIWTMVVEWRKSKAAALLWGTLIAATWRRPFFSIRSITAICPTALLSRCRSRSPSSLFLPPK